MSKCNGPKVARNLLKDCIILLVLFTCFIIYSQFDCTYFWCFCVWYFSEVVFINYFIVELVKSSS